jgi:GT2 family glycosyltransferase
MPLKVLRSVGFFNEDYPMYMVDPDLTASILCAGKKVVMTRRVCVLHRPEWAVSDRAAKKEKRLKGVDHTAIYKRKFYFLHRLSIGEKIMSRMRAALRLPALAGFLSWAFGLNSRDLKNLLNARFISLFDPLMNAYKPYHNTQQISQGILYRENNPYRKLI